jgi:hypothetical protein
MTNPTRAEQLMLNVKSADLKSVKTLPENPHRSGDIASECPHVERLRNGGSQALALCDKGTRPMTEAETGKYVCFHNATRQVERRLVNMQAVGHIGLATLKTHSRVVNATLSMTIHSFSCETLMQIPMTHSHCLFPNGLATSVSQYLRRPNRIRSR